jgi:hypothetical protein
MNLKYKYKYKYKLSACLLIKNETENLTGWIEHYLKQGVEHFYILSNNSTDNIQEYVNQSIFRDKLTLLHDNRDLNIYGNCGDHRNILTNFYDIIKVETEWALLVDIDEFMFGKNGYTLLSFIDTLGQDVGCYYVYWNIFLPAKDDYGNISENFNLYNMKHKRINLDLMHQTNGSIQFSDRFGKSIFRTEMLNDGQQLWMHKVYTNGKILTNYSGETDYRYDNGDYFTWSEELHSKSNVVLNHYAIRNKKDYIAKNCQLSDQHRNRFLVGVFDILQINEDFLIEDNDIIN